MRRAWAEIDLAAVANNVRVVAAAVAPSDVWAVVKADGYGHGALDVARAALDAGSTGLCVALVTEGVALRRDGITAPILLLSEQHGHAGAIVAHGLTPTVYSVGEAVALDAAARTASGGAPVDVHVKIDTGMHRVGVDPVETVALVAAISKMAGLRLAGVFTHLAVADEPTSPANELQLSRFDETLAAIARAGYEVPLVHAANSAAALALPTSRRDLVRLGIAMYGIEPGEGVRHLCGDLRPVMSLHARVSMVKTVRAGEGVSYGLRHVFDRDATVATVPIGYADGVPRRLYGTGGEVLVHGVRRPIVGVITMDQLMIDCGDVPVEMGDEVVFIGEQAGPQGSDTIRAEEWATRLGTIAYEIVCGVSKRIERRQRP